MEEYKGYEIEIEPDLEPDDPRNWDNLGQMVCWHNRYDLGDSNPYSVEEFEEWWGEQTGVRLPLYLYDHSGITMKTGPFHCPWDSGQVGWVYVTRESILKEYGSKYLTRKLRDKARRILESEVEVYDQYLRGDVYGYTITEMDSDGTVDSCGGFYGREAAEQAAKEVVDYVLQNLREKGIPKGQMELFREAA